MMSMAPAPNSNSAVANRQQMTGFSPPVSSSGDKSDRVSGGMCTLPNTPAGTAADSTNKNRSSSQLQQHPNFGGHTLVSTSGNFPSLGSTLGPYFCLGRLGKGTFCSIHRCINLNYFHGSSANTSANGNDDNKRTTTKSSRMAAAKVEIGEFKNSGVLGGEATMLQFLDCSLPEHAVPIYMGHYRGTENVAAIVMEYLPGQDMHQIRDLATRGKGRRRLTIDNAVYLCATVMLPLLKEMHKAGIVHRDVKPSNCVKRGLKDFSMVDFGLSKSVVVPKDSPLSDPEHAWKGTDWIRPSNYTGAGHFRKERPMADFRGTSMYASLRVHQLKDYSPRDDMWSLMYVFCDLVSGGLPWMSHAANRDRESCRLLKQRIHGEQEGLSEQTQELLKGHEYHVALFKRNKGKIDPPEDVNEEVPLPEPLAMSKDEKKLELLQKAFDHLGKLAFWDTPDYDLIDQCVKGFLEGSVEDDLVKPINWERIDTSKREKLDSPPLLGNNVPMWDCMHQMDPLEQDLFVMAEAESVGEVEEKLSGEAAELHRLPLELRFRIAQMEYNTLHHNSIQPHLALRDWFKVALPLLYGEWNARKFEKGGHRTNSDGYRQEVYLKLLDKCLKCAAKFNHFRAATCVYENCDDSTQPKKRRKIFCTILQPSSGSNGSDLIAISQASFRLRAAKKAEERKAYAPPPRLAFGR
jgi:tau tubulin kinase